MTAHAFTFAPDELDDLRARCEEFERAYFDLGVAHDRRRRVLESIADALDLTEWEEDDLPALVAALIESTEVHADPEPVPRRVGNPTVDGRPSIDDQIEQWGLVGIWAPKSRYSKEVDVSRRLKRVYEALRDSGRHTFTATSLARIGGLSGPQASTRIVNTLKSRGAIDARKHGREWHIAFLAPEP